MKLELIGHDEKYALEQSLLTLFPGEKPVYGTVDETSDTRWARVTLTEEDERVQVTTELGVDGKSAAHSYDYPLSGTEYEKEGQRRHAVGISFFGAAKGLLGISPAWGSLTGVRPSKVALSLIREGGKKRAEKELQELYCVTPARARLAIEAADAGIRAAAELEPNDISLYVGIPFCPTRCAYCSFVAQSVEKSFSLVEPVSEALFDEITAAGQLVRELGLNVKSFYMGGGTPTTLTADQMDRLLTKLEQNFDFGNLAELTIEAGRPDTIDEEKLRVLRAHNTTRVSINPQTMEDNVLAAIGRRHTADDHPPRDGAGARRQLPARQHGFDRGSARGHARGLCQESRRGHLDGRGQHHGAHAVAQKGQPHHARRQPHPRRGRGRANAGLCRPHAA